MIDNPHMNRSCSLVTLSSESPPETIASESGSPGSTPPSSAPLTPDESRPKDPHRATDGALPVGSDIPLLVQHNFLIVQDGETCPLEADMSMQKTGTLSRAAHKARSAAKKVTQLLKKKSANFKNRIAPENSEDANNVSYMRNIPIEVLDGNVIEYVETVCAVVSEVEYLNLAGSDRIYEVDDDSGDSGMRTSPRETPPLRPQSRMSTRPREQTYTVPFAFDSPEECLHTLFFPIWTAMVGGALLMYPESLPSLVFEKGYAPVPTSPLDRIAYYGNCAVPHVWIFIGCVVSTALVNTRVFGTLALLVTLRTMHVWRGYANSRAERLLNERRQSEEIKQWEMDMWCVYLVFAGKEEQFSSLLSSL